MPPTIEAAAETGARVVGIMAWITVGDDDLTAMTIDSGGQVPPTAWGVPPARPANCRIGKCCVVAEDEVIRPQPDPVNGVCSLVFQADRYSMTWRRWSRRPSSPCRAARSSRSAQSRL